MFAIPSEILEEKNRGIELQPLLARSRFPDENNRLELDPLFFRLEYFYLNFEKQPLFGYQACLSDLADIVKNSNHNSCFLDVNQAAKLRQLIEIILDKIQMVIANQCYLDVDTQEEKVSMNFSENFLRTKGFQAIEEIDEEVLILRREQRFCLRQEDNQSNAPKSFSCFSLFQSCTFFWKQEIINQASGLSDLVDIRRQLRLLESRMEQLKNYKTTYERLKYRHASIDMPSPAFHCQFDENKVHFLLQTLHVLQDSLIVKNLVESKIQNCLKLLKGFFDNTKLILDEKLNFLELIKDWSNVQEVNLKLSAQMIKALLLQLNKIMNLPFYTEFFNRSLLDDLYFRLSTHAFSLYQLAQHTFLSHEHKAFCNVLMLSKILSPLDKFLPTDRYQSVYTEFQCKHQDNILKFSDQLHQKLEAKDFLDVAVMMSFLMEIKASDRTLLDPGLLNFLFKKNQTILSEFIIDELISLKLKAVLSDADENIGLWSPVFEGLKVIEKIKKEMRECLPKEILSQIKAIHAEIVNRMNEQLRELLTSCFLLARNFCLPELEKDRKKLITLFHLLDSKVELDLRQKIKNFSKILKEELILLIKDYEDHSDGRFINYLLNPPKDFFKALNRVKTKDPLYSEIIENLRGILIRVLDLRLDAIGKENILAEDIQTKYFKLMLTTLPPDLQLIFESKLDLTIPLSTKTI